MAILIEPSAIRVLYYTTSSCGHAWAKDLLKFRAATSLSSLQKVGPDSEAFVHLEAYAKRNGFKRLGASEVLLYFADFHVNDANRSVHFDPKITSSANNYVGKLLANCVLWPLEEESLFVVGKRRISISGAEDLGGNGSLFLHRRAIFRAPIDEKTLAVIKSHQEANRLFMGALERIGDRLELPILPKT